MFFINSQNIELLIDIQVCFMNFKLLSSFYEDFYWVKVFIKIVKPFLKVTKHIFVYSLSSICPRSSLIITDNRNINIFCHT